MRFADAVENAVQMFKSSAFLDRIREEDSSMLKHLGILQKINQRGFITVDSQAGRQSSGRQSSGSHYKIEERAYVTGFMLESDAVEFIKRMGIETDKNAVFVAMVDDHTNIPGISTFLSQLQRRTVKSKSAHICRWPCLRESGTRTASRRESTRAKKLCI